MNKKLKYTYIFLFVYCIATGLFLSHEELWLQENELSVSSVGIILSVGTILACLTILIFANYINKKNIKKFITLILIIKSAIMGSLFLLNSTNLLFFIKLFVMIDYILNIELLASTYPLMAYIKKSDQVFAIKEIIVEVGTNVGVIISVLLLNKIILSYKIDYNFLFFLGTLINIISIFILQKLKIDSITNSDLKQNNIYDLLKKIKKSKSLIFYCCFIFFNNLAYYCIIGISLLLLINGMHLSLNFVNNWQVITILLSAFIGYLFLKTKIVKNDYLAIFIKLGMRVILYIFAFLFTNNIMGMIAISYTMISCLMFPDILEGKNINKFTTSEQLAVSNLREILARSGRAVGIYLCSLAITYSLRFVYLFGTIFGIIQIIFILLTIKFSKE